MSASRISLCALLCLAGLPAMAADRSTALFDGKTFAGWEGDTRHTWRIEDGCIVGGSLNAKIPRNQFLASKQSYANFVLRLKFKLLGESKKNFVNSGVQFRSQSVPNATEMTGVMSMAVAWLQEGSMLAAQIVDAYTLALESMIPGEVCTTNRVTQQGLIDTNIGQNTPAIIALELEYMGHFWTQNASMMATYQAVVSAALAALATPPPMNPAVANPAGPLAGVVQAGADAAAGSLQSGFQGVSQTAGTAAPATQAPASATTDGMSQAMSMPMQMVGQLSQFGQMAGQLPQMLGQAPQMLSQAVQLPMGMLGRLGNTGGLGGAGAPVDAASTATLSQAAMSTGGAGIGGGGGGIGSGGSGVVPSSFTRPASSFTAPNAPKLPTGFGGANAALVIEEAP